MLTEDLNTEDARKLLVERLASSRYIRNSARLRELLLYLCKRVLDDSVAEIHEQEVGHKVFGRSPDYDTAADNIVRVHASLLRKRLDQYFATEGRAEAIIVAIPKGNYAPVFRERPAASTAEPSRQSRRAPADWRMWLLAVLTVVFAGSTLLLLLRTRREGKPAIELQAKPAVRLFWSQVFRSGQQTDIVLDDAAVGLYQELLGRAVGLSGYFDRSYLRKLDQTAPQAKLGQGTAESIVLRRHSSYASSSFLWRLYQTAGPLQKQAALHFARDYSFRGLKTNNVVLLGNSRSNPWVEPFESRVGVRWAFDELLGIYYPIDTWAAPGERDRFRITAGPDGSREGYCGICLLPNLTGTGNVLIVAGTGGSALNAGADFLGDEQSVGQLRRLLSAGKDNQFPHFEALLRIKARSTLPKDTTIVICRAPRS